MQRLRSALYSSYHHLSVTDSVDLRQGTISSLVLYEPVHGVTHQILVNVNARKLLSFAEYPHYKSGQP